MEKHFGRHRTLGTFLIGPGRQDSIPFGDLTWLAVAAVIAGVAIRVLAGVFGVGGGAIVVPVLYELFRLLGVSDAVRLQLCIGTSLPIILPTRCALSGAQGTQRGDFWGPTTRMPAKAFMSEVLSSTDVQLPSISSRRISSVNHWSSAAVNSSCAAASAAVLAANRLGSRA